MCFRSDRIGFLASRLNFSCAILQIPVVFQVEHEILGFVEKVFNFFIVVVSYQLIIHSILHLLNWRFIPQIQNDTRNGKIDSFQLIFSEDFHSTHKASEILFQIIIPISIELSWFESGRRITKPICQFLFSKHHLHPHPTVSATECIDAFHFLESSQRPHVTNQIATV